MNTIYKLPNNIEIEVTESGIPILFKNKPRDNTHVVCPVELLNEFIKMRELLQAVYDATMNGDTLEAVGAVIEYIESLPK